MNYDEMSDREINLAVAEIVYPEAPHMHSNEGDPRIAISVEDDVFNGVVKMFDPCNSWTDAGPIIEESRISLWPMLETTGDINEPLREIDKWEAAVESEEFDSQWGYQRCAHDKKPTRAAMICFLKMEEASNGQ